MWGRPKPRRERRRHRGRSPSFSTRSVRSRSLRPCAFSRCTTSRSVTSRPKARVAEGRLRQTRVCPNPRFQTPVLPAETGRKVARGRHYLRICTYLLHTATSSEFRGESADERFDAAATGARRVGPDVSAALSECSPGRGPRAERPLPFDRALPAAARRTAVAIWRINGPPLDPVQSGQASSKQATRSLVAVE